MCHVSRPWEIFDVKMGFHKTVELCIVVVTLIDLEAIICEGKQFGINISVAYII